MTPRTPNWWPKLQEAAHAHDVTLTEAVTLVEILHDDNCARLQGTGVCDCDPDVQLRSQSLQQEETTE